MNTIVRLTLALLATTAVLAACTKEIVTERTDTASVFGQADDFRVITISFGPQTKTALGNNGLQRVSEPTPISWGKNIPGYARLEPK